MASSLDCSQNIDPLKLVDGGTSQQERVFNALDPAYAPVNEHGQSHGIVFAQAYAAFLKYYDSDNVFAGDWTPLFKDDMSAHLAFAAIQDVELYRQSVKEFADFLNDRSNSGAVAELRNRLDYLFSVCATGAVRIDQFSKKLKEDLDQKRRMDASSPADENVALPATDEIARFALTLRKLVKGQLAPALQRLIAYHKGAEAIVDLERPLNSTLNEKAAPIGVLGGTAVKFSTLRNSDLSDDWTDGTSWAAFYNVIPSEDSVYGVPLPPTAFDRMNHFATHNLFTSILEQFLKAYSRIVYDAQVALEASLTNWAYHEPHYALFLAFLRLFEYARTQGNTLTARHLDFYYREILRLKERPAEPASAHLLVELAKQVVTHQIKEGELFKAGKDDRGVEAFFANTSDFIANAAKVDALKTLYRHGAELVGISAPTGIHKGRLFDSPISNSEDGLGAELISADQSWHPFYNKVYQDGKLASIPMQQAEVGFAIASNCLWMAEGTRTITVDFTIDGKNSVLMGDFKDDVICLLTGEKEWIVGTPKKFSYGPEFLRLEIEITGADPAVVAYSAKVHGYNFATTLPVLLVKLRHREDTLFVYPRLQDVVIRRVGLRVSVRGLKTLAVSNDFGPVDTSKPFQPFGAAPIADSALIVGSREAFQKDLSYAGLNVTWQVQLTGYKKNPGIFIESLAGGKWVDKFGAIPLSWSFNLSDALESAPNIEDFLVRELFSTSSRHGFVRLSLSSDLGQSDYQTDLRNFLIDKATKAANPTPEPKPAPVIPVLSAITLDYDASETIGFSAVETYFHLTPFGTAAQRSFLADGSAGATIYLLPQFHHLNATDEKLPKGHPVTHDAEFYIGVSALKPPQNLALLFQVADGTADPLADKPDPHVHWSYLRDNEWIAFAQNDVSDQTSGLINSGIVTLAVPRDASSTNTLFPAGMYWVRAAVASLPEAVCRLVRVAAQALKATFVDKQNDPAFPAKVLPPETITKLDMPAAEVKKISQPFVTFGGRGEEESQSFYTRVSERLRHKDRAIAMWDYERLVLDAFPQIYRAKCLNHTQYESTEDGKGIYRELAPGHVTIVTIPNQQLQNLRDPLRPYTSLGLLKQIETYLRKRLSCFIKLHVKNPQFEEVYTDFSVRLVNGRDESFYRNQLQEEITKFLSPWAFSSSLRPSFGGKVFKSVLINFVEERSYVDYVTDFKLFHKYRVIDSSGTETEVVSPDLSEVEGSRAVSILVSVPSKNHLIQVIHPNDQERQADTCPCEA